MKRAIPELSIDTQTLERLLREVVIGDVISYRVLSAAIGRNVQTVARGNLASARRRLFADRLLFEPVINEGLKRLGDLGKVGMSATHVLRSHAQAKLARKKAASIDDFNALPNNVKVEHNIVLAQAGVIEAITSPRAHRRLEAAVSDAKPALSLSESLELMKPAL